MSVGIIGCGSLGRSLLTAFRKQYSDFRYSASVRTESSVLHLRSKYQVKATTDNREVARSAQVLLCVKPLQAKDVCNSIRGHLDKRTVVVSAMAAVPFEKLQQWLDHNQVVKIMPTVLPDGPITVYNPLGCPFLFPTRNQIEVNTEAELDLSTAVSGCMPGLLAYLLEEWIEASIEVGTHPKVAEQLILKNLQAISRLDFKKKGNLIQLRRQVSSKGGATERGVLSLDRSGIRSTLTEMLWQANSRVSELVKILRSEE